jgi:predicted nucleic acid-binding protein
LLRFWKIRDVTLCSSRYAVEEARVNLGQPGQKKRLTTLAERLEIVEAAGGDDARLSGIFLPEKDLPILRAAIAARATHLITGDIKHFGAYFGQKADEVLVMSPSGYLRSRGLV